MKKYHVLNCIDYIEEEITRLDEMRLKETDVMKIWEQLKVVQEKFHKANVEIEQKKIDCKRYERFCDDRNWSGGKYEQNIVIRQDVIRQAEKGIAEMEEFLSQELEMLLDLEQRPGNQGRPGNGKRPRPPKPSADTDESRAEDRLFKGREHRNDEEER